MLKIAMLYFTRKNKLFCYSFWLNLQKSLFPIVGVITFLVLVPMSSSIVIFAACKNAIILTFFSHH